MKAFARGEKLLLPLVGTDCGVLLVKRDDSWCNGLGFSVRCIDLGDFASPCDYRMPFQ